MQLGRARICAIIFLSCVLTSVSVCFRVAVADGDTSHPETSSNSGSLHDMPSILTVGKTLSDTDSGSVIGGDQGVLSVPDEEKGKQSSRQRYFGLQNAVQSASHRVFQFAHVSEEPGWPELNLGWRTITSMIGGGVGAALSSAGGLGGGGLFVPLFNLLLQFDAKTSAALSNFMILGGSIVNLKMNLGQRHPFLRDKPLIDFDLVLLLQPNMLLGISAGVILNVVLADWIITAVLTLTLTIMTVHSFKSARRRWDKETQQNTARLAKAANDEIEYDCGPIQYGTAYDPDCRYDAIGPYYQSSSDDCATEDNENLPPELGSADGPKTGITQYGSLTELLLGTTRLPTFPKVEVSALAVTWLAFFAVQILRQGTPIFPVQTCGLAYWLLTSTQIPLAFLITAWTIKRLRAVRPAKEDSETVQDAGFILKPESCRWFAWMGLVAGVSGGLLGIGGGMIVNPMLLAVGMVPQVTAATCAAMVFFSSSMSVVQFWLMGRVPIKYALVFMAVSAAFSFVGVRLVHRAISKSNRASLIVFSVATVMGLSALLMGLFGGWDVWQSYLSGGYMGFHYPC